MEAPEGCHAKEQGQDRKTDKLREPEVLATFDRLKSRDCWGRLLKEERRFLDRIYGLA